MSEDPRSSVEILGGRVSLPEDVLEAAGEYIWCHTPVPRYTRNDCCRALDGALPIILPTIKEQVLDTLIERVAFGGWSDVVLIEEDEQGDPVTVGEWLLSYRDNLSEDEQ